MNKQLIITYFEEFNHWLNGGSVLMGKRDSVNNIVKWYPSVTNPFIEISESITVIINDEFVEFRKALAEGKTIEYLGQSSNLWQELEDANFNLHQTCYRIKPDEPKFKVGDFVRYIHHSPNTLALQINNINCGRYYFVNSCMTCVKHELEPWKPIKGEWCWFYDSKTNKYSHLSQFNSINNGYFKSMSINYYNFCEPFLNSKPSYLRDK